MNLLKIINIFITFVDKYDLNVLDMQEKSLNDEYFCGPWNDLVEMIEVSAKRIVEVERHMYPYSNRRKWCVFKNRNNELFSLLALVRKLESLISQKLENISKQMFYTERHFVENISYRLSLLTEGDLRNKALSCYQPFQALSQEEISKRTWHKQAVGTDADSLIGAVFGMISEIQPQELVSRIFDQLSSICRIIDFPPEVDDQTKIEALRKEISRRTFSFKQDFENAQANFIFGRNPSGTIDDLTNEDNLQILQSLRQTYEEKVCTNIEYGEGYKRYKVNGFDLETIARFHYHARDVQFFLNNLIHLIVIERKIKELECQIEEEKEQASNEQQTNLQEQAENNHVIYAMGVKEFIKKWDGHAGFVHGIEQLEPAERVRARNDLVKDIDNIRTSFQTQYEQNPEGKWKSDFIKKNIWNGKFCKNTEARSEFFSDLLGVLPVSKSRLTNLAKEIEESGC